MWRNILVAIDILRKLHPDLEGELSTVLEEVAREIRVSPSKNQQAMDCLLNLRKVHQELREAIRLANQEVQGRFSAGVVRPFVGVQDLNTQAWAGVPRAQAMYVEALRALNNIEDIARRC